MKENKYTDVAYLSLVGVRRFSVDTSVVDDVFESVVHESTVTAFVTVGGGAVHQVLFTQGDQGASADVVLTFNTSSLTQKEYPSHDDPLKLDLINPPELKNQGSTFKV